MATLLHNQSIQSAPTIHADWFMVLQCLNKVNGSGGHNSELPKAWSGHSVQKEHTARVKGYLIPGLN
jgi:hypothetical protein